MEVRHETVDGPDGPFELVTLYSVQPFENNVYVLSDPESQQCLVIDASEAAPILEAVEGRHVQAVLLTHGHRDHVAAVAELREWLPVPFLIGAADQELVAEPIDGTIADNQAFAFGRHTLRAIATPGHTWGGTCFLIGDVLLSGDTLFPGGPGNTRKETNRWGDFATIIESLKTRLFSLPDETRVLPGHGRATTIGAERPHLEEWVARGW